MTSVVQMILLLPVWKANCAMKKFRFPKIKCVIKILLLFPLKITHYKCSNRLSIILDKMAGNNDKLHDWS